MKWRTWLRDWLAILISAGIICGASFAGSSKILAYLLKEQFCAIYTEINSLKTNLKILEERTINTNYTVNKIWDKIK